MTITYTFREVKIKGVKKWKGEDGKRHTTTRTFSQTINPFNKNKEGKIKSRDEIMTEITAERDAWIKEVSPK